MNLDNLRKQIDSIDTQIVNALSRRCTITLQISKLKKQLGRQIYSPERERQVLSRLKKIKHGLLSDEALEAIYREIMSAALSLERPLTIAYLGPEATFTHLAAIKKFGQQLTYLPCDSISGVFKEVLKRSANYGVVPVENSIEGAVTHTLDMLIDSDVKICAQIVMNVSHNLLAKCARRDIRKIYSNPQVFAQCRLWLKENFPKAELIDASSTSRAAQIARENKNTAAIASILAARVYGLKVIAQNIEDSPSNITRFLVIGENGSGPTGNDKTSIVFSIKDRVGALYDMLIPFKKYRINLTKIESRPSKKRAWDYYFFMDLEGHIQDKDTARALKELEARAKFFKILGSYPNAE